jgi:hypothetical protein
MDFGTVEVLDISAPEGFSGIISASRGTISEIEGTGR